MFLWKPKTEGFYKLVAYSWKQIRNPALMRGSLKNVSGEVNSDNARTVSNVKAKKSQSNDDDP